MLPASVGWDDRIIERDGTVLVIRRNALLLRREYPGRLDYPPEVEYIVLAENSKGETLLTTISYQGSLFTIVNSMPTRRPLDLLKVCQRLREMGDEEALQVGVRLIESQFPSWLEGEVVVE